MAFDEALSGHRIREAYPRVKTSNHHWKSEVMAAGRAKGQLPPAAFRIQAAAASLDEVEEEAV